MSKRKIESGPSGSKIGESENKIPHASSSNEEECVAVSK